MALSAEDREALAYYQEELDQLDRALLDIESLYDETKEHYDEVKNSRSRGSLSFAHLQLGNLISMRNSRVNIIKEKISVKKTIADFQMKEKRAEGAGAGDTAMIAELMRQLNRQDAVNKNAPAVEEEEDDADDALERRIAELEGSGKLKFTDNERAVKYERGAVPPEESDEEEDDGEEEAVKEQVRIAVLVKDKKWAFVAVNEEGRIVKGHELPNKSDHKIKLIKIEGVTTAVDQNDRMFQVIRR